MKRWRFIRTSGSLAAFAAALSAGPGYASSAIADARIVFVGVYGDGSASIVIDKTIDETACPAQRIEVPAANAKMVLATAYTALATGKLVTVATSGCYRGGPGMNSQADTNSYIFIQNP